MSLAYAECKEGQVKKGFVTVVGIANPDATAKTKGTVDLVDDEKCWEYETVKIPYVECTEDGPKRKTLEVLVKKGSLKDDDFKKLEASADLAAIGCRTGKDVIHFPENYQIRLGSDVPQAILVWREVKTDDGSTAKTDDDGKIIWGIKRSQTNIPHCNLTKDSNFPDLSPHKKGQYYARLTLKDNSNSWVYAETAEKASEIMEEIIGLINPEKVDEKPLITVGERRGKALGDYLAYPYKIEYYSKGQQQGAWDWRLRNDS
jgi:hypothetical protein